MWLVQVKMYCFCNTPSTHLLGTIFLYSNVTPFQKGNIKISVVIFPQDFLTCSDVRLDKTFITSLVSDIAKVSEKVSDKTNACHLHNFSALSKRPADLFYLLLLSFSIWTEVLKRKSRSLPYSHSALSHSILSFEYRSRQTIPNQIGRDDPFDSDWLRKGLLELKNS